MNVRLQHTMPFTAGVWYGDEMRMNNYILRISMTTNSHHAGNHNIAFERIKYFIYHELDSTIFINSEYQDQCYSYIAAGLNITTLPAAPVDQLIGIMLYYKLTAILEDRMIISETEVSSSMGDNMVYLHGENETPDGVVCPGWWTSADLVHCDLDLLESDKVVTMHHAGAWQELDLLWPDVEDNVDSNNTIVFSDFNRDDTK